MANNTSKKRYWLLKSLELIATILPLCILIAIRHEKYIYSKNSAIAFSVGFFLAVFVIVLCVFEKLHLKGLGWSIVLFSISMFLENILDDIQWILLCFMMGQVTSKIIGLFAKGEDERVAIERSAKASAEKMAEAIGSYLNGRV